jgi:chromosome segregation ATPase
MRRPHEEHRAVESLETYDDLPAFVPEKDLRTALTAAQSVARQRDELAAEVARLRRELEAATRAQHERDSALSVGDNVTRRLKLLRDALARKDQEILSLKSFASGHAKQLREAQETAERLRRERSELEQRLRSREGAFQAIEREREALSAALDDARRDSERAAQVVVQADHAVHEWRRALDACTRELDAARQQITELRAAWQTATQERQRLAEAHASELARVRAEGAAALERLRHDMDTALAEATTRYDAAREAHAIALRAAEDAHAEELAEAAAARARLEESLAEARARVAQVEQARNWADGELAAVRARLATAEAVAESTARELKESFGREIDALRKAHEAERQSIVANYEAELRALRAAKHGGHLEEVRALTERYTESEAMARRLAAEKVECEARLAALQAELAQALAERDEAQSSVVDALAARDARHAAAIRECHERMEEMRTAHEAAMADARRDFTEALTAQREAMEAKLGLLQDVCDGGNARVADLEHDLEAARQALGEYAAEAMARLQVAERTAEEAIAARERYARKYAVCARELQRLRRELEGVGHTRTATALAMETMARAIELLARAIAERAGRRAPEPTDVEEALSLLGEELPEEVAELLWSLREPLAQRCRRTDEP